MIFICGGVRSGKSSYAEDLVSRINGNLIYIATSIPYDEEVEQRINKHLQDREKYGFSTIEKYSNLSEISNQFSKDDVILLDCLTNLVANELYEEAKSSDEVITDVITAIKSINDKVKEIVIVSNDLFSGGLGDYIESNQIFLRTLGKIHQEITTISRECYESTYGIISRRK